MSEFTVSVGPQFVMKGTFAECSRKARELGTKASVRRYTPVPPVENATLTGKPAFTVLADGKDAICYGCGKTYKVDMSRTGTVLVCPTCADLPASTNSGCIGEGMGKKGGDLKDAVAKNPFLKYSPLPEAIVPDKHWGTWAGSGNSQRVVDATDARQSVTYVDGKLTITKDYQATTMTYTVHGPLKEFHAWYQALLGQWPAEKWGTDVTSTKATVPNSTFVVTRNLKEA